MHVIDHAKFIDALKEQYPQITDQIDDDFRGLLHCEMGRLAVEVQLAVSAEDLEAVRGYFKFIGEVYRRHQENWKRQLKFETILFAGPVDLFSPTTSPNEAYVIAEGRYPLH